MQNEFDFSSPAAAGPDGLTAWRRQRREHLEELARTNGLPLGHECRVELCGGVVLEGLLRLAEDALLLPVPERNLNLQLQIERCQFSTREIVSVVRMD